MHNQPIIKIALFGLGYMGQNHLRVLNMLKDVEIAFVYDTNESLACQIASQHNVCFCLIMPMRCNLLTER